MSGERPARILVVDDNARNAALLEAILVPRGYEVTVASDGPTALEMVERSVPDLVLLDVQMPGMDGFEVCRRLRARPETEFLPIVMVTATAESQKATSTLAGADDFIRKPVDQAELMARVTSLVRIKRYRETIERQAAELRELNGSLEARVADQIDELSRLTRLRRFLPPQVADVILSADDRKMLGFHRSEIAVLFFDLRRFTTFANETEPEYVMRALTEVHETFGALVKRYEATVGFFAGDGLMVFFNDPVPQPDAMERALNMAVELRQDMNDLVEEWSMRGYDLSYGIGLDLGMATLGEMGFEGRFDYGAIGSVVNLASRLCAEATDEQILISGRARSAVREMVDCEGLGDVVLRGFPKPVPVWSVTGVREPSASWAG